MIDSITRITLNLQETNTMVSIRAKRGDTCRKLLIHLSDGSIPYHISDDCYATFTAKKPDGTKINNACTIENNVIEYEFTEQTCTAVGTMKAEIRLYGADDKMITSACFLVNVYDTVFRDGDEVGSETEMNTLDDLILRANAFLNETGKLLRWHGNWDSETEYETNDLVLHEQVLYVAEEAIAAGTAPGSEEVTAWVPIAGMGTGNGENIDLTDQVKRAETAATEAETASKNANTAMTTANIYRANAKTSETNAANSATRAEDAAKRAEDAAANTGNGSGGNVDLTGVVKSVNGVTPDENGNVEVETVEVTDEQIAKAFDAYLEEHPVTIVFDDLEEYEAFTVVTDSGEVVDPENPGEDEGGDDTELTYQSYVGYGEDLMLQYDAIQQYSLGYTTSGGAFYDVSGNNFPTADNGTKYCVLHPTYISPESNGNCTACDCDDETLLNTLNEANQITVEFVGQRIDSTTGAKDVACVQPNGNTALIYDDGTMKPLGASSKYGTASLDNTAIKHNSVTFDGSEWKMYSEGELVATYTSNTALNCTTVACLGYRGWARSNPMYFNTMRVYKRALTAAEIKTNYNIDIARFGTVNVEVTA